MNQLLERPDVVLPPIQTYDRRNAPDRRHGLSSMTDFYRWLSAVSLKIGGAVLVAAALTTWWQKIPVNAHAKAAPISVASYRWHGFHRVGTS